MYIPCYSDYDGNERVIFSMLVCEGLIGDYVMAVCEFNGLDCECRRG